MKMPVMFVGHGSPMNAIENNEYTRTWEELGERLPRPKAILSVSAHWFTDGTKVSDAETPKTIYDMYGFPSELYEVVYGAKGSPEFAHKTKELLGNRVSIDNSWGLDHGTWSVLLRVYPEADIPVFQLSVDRDALLQEHYSLGKKLRPLRNEGILILGSGNIVHNLSKVNWKPESCYDWAREFDEYIKNRILEKDFDSVVHYKKAGRSALEAFNIIDHYAPLLYVLGASDEDDEISVFNNSCTFGSMSMTSYLFEKKR